MLISDNKIKKMMAFVMSVIVCTFLFIPITVHADSNDSGNEAIKLYGAHKIVNGSVKTGKFTFVLEARDDTCPMPDGSSGRIKKVTISPNGTFDFGTVKFEKPGTYEYTISREIIKSKDLEQDESVYKIKIAHFNDGTTVVVYEKVGMKEKPAKIEYVDKYIKSGSNSTSNSTSTKSTVKHILTGDTDTLIKLGMTFGLASFLILLILAIRKRNEK